MPRKTITLAEGWRAHREAFELAQAKGITPAEAAELLKARAARTRWAETERRLRAQQSTPLRTANPEVPPQWWNRD